MSHIAVVGTQFGDAGKGVTVDRLCLHPNTVVVRFNGGAQASHNVIHNGIHHDFHQYGSGSLRKGVSTYLAPTMRVSLDYLLTEMRTLKQKLGEAPQMTISGDCLMVTHYHKAKQQESFDGWVSNCGFGVGVAYGHSLNYPDEALYIKDLFNLGVLEKKLRWQSLYFNSNVSHDVIYNFYLECLRELEDNGVTFDIENTYQLPTNVVYEGAQGALLHEDLGIYPPHHVTWSDTSCVSLPALDEAIGVLRIYQTRHGNGAFPTEANLPFREAHNVTNQFQGVFRTGFLDLDLTKYAIDVVNQGKITGLAVTHVDKFYVGIEAKMNNEYIKFDALDEMLYTIQDFLERPIFHIGYGAQSHEYNTTID